ncbi:bifunctional riboflavin kinase/FAD synthetase [Bacteroidales bacterium]|nr:bifunctional riboflavin kinase/FAD synthetase [Bacteroidales bacterium]
MRIIYVDEAYEFIPAQGRQIAATIGFFDGVHKGHRFLIDQLKEIAKAANQLTAIITFGIHPRLVLDAYAGVELLNSFDEKLRLLSDTGIDYCFVLDFTKSFSQLSAGDFIEQYLYSKIHVRSLLIGFDHHFGKGAIDDFSTYRLLGEQHGISMTRAEALSAIELSSSAIRQYLKQGKVREAQEMLSYNYILEGLVIEGNKMGRKFGFPTANISLLEKNKLVPGDGIYAVWVYIGEQKLRGMCYLGARPTLFDHGEARIEVNILDFEGDIYGVKLCIEFIAFVRGDIKFAKTEGLIQQLAKDELAVREIFTRLL